MKRTLNHRRHSGILGVHTGMLWVLVSGYAAPAEVAPPTILQIDVENTVQYHEDLSDVSKFATDPRITTAVVPRDFHAVVIIGDIVAVNGQPAKGTVTRSVRTATLTTAPNPGQAIADTVHNGLNVEALEILSVDGTPIGTIMGLGLGGGAVPAGVPLTLTGGNLTIVGGTGAFLGARGQEGTGVASQGPPARQASFVEDPANRRTNGGGRVRFVLEVIPMTLPQVVADIGGPVITHADFSPVTTAKPAKPAEVLIVKATGLGPTVPGVGPGQPFPLDTLQRVNSPLGVSVNGQSAEVVNAIGWPGQVDTFRVDFRMPNSAVTGTAAIQLTAAWITGAAVGIPVQ